MKAHQKNWRKIVVFILVIVSLSMTTPVTLADGPRAGVLSPNSSWYGKTYGEWSAAQWKWLYSLPVDHHPLFDTADCSAGQSGKVWFLGGTFTVVETAPNVVVGNATRNCRVPSGKALFFPIIDAECAVAEGNGSTEAELRACAVNLVNHATDLSAEIDRVPVQNLGNYRVQSPLFTWGPLPANNALSLPSGITSPSVSDGYFLLVAPFKEGKHTIHFKGSAKFVQATDGFDFTFSLDITYNLTVVED
jgi:hypothetical protein